MFTFLQTSFPAPFLAEASPDARMFFQQSFLQFFTNSFFVALVVLGGILWLARKATTNMQLVPHPVQNFFELVVEFLYDRVEAIVGPKVAPRAFPLLATLFIFILISNWFGLVPGVGTVGWGEGHGFFSLHHVTTPVLRPPTADLNMTLGLALSFFVVWTYLTISEIGVWGFIKHTFGPKGGLKGVMGFVVALVFVFVGLIEIVSILFRPVTLSLRLFGNVYAGENLLDAMMGLAEKASAPFNFMGSVLFPFPFYFMELLVGLLQAVVFTLLCTVYIQLSTTHDEHHEEDKAHH
jgi:F-type H+-transporting ATPase subunit a